jgi:hypothetical protein
LKKLSLMIRLFEESNFINNLSFLFNKLSNLHFLIMIRFSFIAFNKDDDLYTTISYFVKLLIISIF